MDELMTRILVYNQNKRERVWWFTMLSIPKRTLKTPTGRLSVLSLEQDIHPVPLERESDSEESLNSFTPTIHSIQRIDPDSLHYIQHRMMETELPRPMEKTKDAKVIELSKKARRLTVAYEKEKTRNDALEKQLKQILQENHDKPPIQPQMDQKLVKDKLNIINRKLEEERIHVQKLKLEITNLNKILIKEVGPDFSLNKYQQSVGWKGRQEQISLLKEKLKDMKQRLEQQKSPLDYQSTLLKLQSKSKEELDQTHRELEETKAQYQQLKGKHDGATSRIK